MIPILRLDQPEDCAKAEELLRRLRLDPMDFILSRGEFAGKPEIVRGILAAVAQRGDAALVEVSRKFDDPNFTADRIRVSPDETRAAAERLPAEQMAALRRSIQQVRQYQQHVMPVNPAPLKRGGLELGLRFTPLDSVGLLIPGGKAAYPSTLIMLAVPAQVAGVQRIAVCSPPTQHGQSDIYLATCHELKLTEVFRAGGAAAVGALALGTATIRPVDKILGPGNVYVQLAKQALSGCVGIDGFLGPSEIVTLADDTARPDFVAADLLAQAEHDPGSCFLLTNSEKLAAAVKAEIEKQSPSLQRINAITAALRDHSAIMIGSSLDELYEWANRFAAEHVNLQLSDNLAALKALRHAGAIFIGKDSPVAAGDYIAGPSHCLPTNTTARFSNGVSVFDFLKRSSTEQYDAASLAADADAIITLANAEGLDAHAQSVRIRK